eukprot:1064327-Pelagomonas_calceolata.AAC.1
MRHAWSGIGQWPASMPRPQSHIRRGGAGLLGARSLEGGVWKWEHALKYKWKRNSDQVFKRSAYPTTHQSGHLGVLLAGKVMLQASSSKQPAQYPGQITSLGLSPYLSGIPLCSQLLPMPWPRDQGAYTSNSAPSAQCPAASVPLDRAKSQCRPCDL